MIDVMSIPYECLYVHVVVMFERMATLADQSNERISVKKERKRASM